MYTKPVEIRFTHVVTLPREQCHVHVHVHALVAVGSCIHVHVHVHTYFVRAINEVVDSASLSGDGFQKIRVMIRSKSKRVHCAIELLPQKGRKYNEWEPHTTVSVKCYIA